MALSRMRKRKLTDRTAKPAQEKPFARASIRLTIEPVWQHERKEPSRVLVMAAHAISVRPAPQRGAGDKMQCGGFGTAISNRTAEPLTRGAATPLQLVLAGPLRLC